MDEIKKIKEIKNTVKIVNIGIIAFLGSIAFFSFIISPSKSAIQTSIGLIIFAIILQIINMTMYMTIKLYYKISYSKIDINLLNQEYEREIEGMPPPAVASYLYNRNIEVFRDYTATILNLYVKKYIVISDFENNVKINIEKSKDLSKLQSHEKYVYDCISGQNKFDEEKFKNLILEDIENEGLMKKVEIDYPHILNTLMILIILALNIIYILIQVVLSSKIELDDIIFGLLICDIMIAGCYKKIYQIIKKKFFTVYRLQNKGKEELKKIKNLKNFMKQYTLIYENVCDYLDNQFREKNICDFKNDKCIANRENKTAHSIMGCCYSFEYCSLFSPQFIKNEHLCKYQQNRNCTTKCITCKLFTCKYLKEKGIKFDSHKLPLLECFFNKKQHSILTSNFFKTEEEIINNLVNT